MLKLFGYRQAQDDVHAPEEVKRNTRFAHTHSRPRAKITAKPAKQPYQTAPAAPEPPAAPVLWQREEPPSLADQLHSESEISVALLRRALPSRFAEMDAETRALAKRNRDELLAPPQHSPPAPNN